MAEKPTAVARCASHLARERPRHFRFAGCDELIQNSVPLTARQGKIAFLIMVLATSGEAHAISPNAVDVDNDHGGDVRTGRPCGRLRSLNRLAHAANATCYG